MLAAEKEFDSPRNSDIREITNGPLLRFAKWFHHNKYFSWVTPNQITYFGAITQPIGSLIAVLVMNKDQDEITIADRIKAAVAASTPQAPDGFDGKLATIIKQEEPEKVDPNGDCIDFTADRWGEAVVAAEMATSAYLRGDLFGEVAAYAWGATNPLTSYYRAMAESRGKIVHELKWGPQVLGNRFGRFVTSVVSVALPETQPWINTISALSNGLSANYRREIVLKDALIIELDPVKRAQRDQIKELAEKRLAISEKVVPLTIAAMVGTAVGLRVIDRIYSIRKTR